MVIAMGACMLYMLNMIRAESYKILYIFFGFGVLFFTSNS